MKILWKCGRARAEKSRNENNTNGNLKIIEVKLIK